MATGRVIGRPKKLLLKSRASGSNNGFSSCVLFIKKESSIKNKRKEIDLILCSFANSIKLTLRLGRNMVLIAQFWTTWSLLMLDSDITLAEKNK